MTTDQLNSTIHGTMKTSPYELVFGQPPTTAFFPGAHGVDINEEDVEDLLHDDILSDPQPSKNDPPPTPSKNDHPPPPAKNNPPPSKNDLPTSPEIDTPPASSETDPDTQHCLGTSEKHLRIRRAADKLYKRNAENMQLKYSKGKRKKVTTFSVGNIVSVKVPRIDRTSTDLRRLVCIVVEW